MRMMQCLEKQLEINGIPTHYAAYMRKKMVQYLVDEGLLVHEDQGDGHTRTVPTDTGISKGISEKKFTKANGEEYMSLDYGDEVMEMMAEKIIEFKEQIDREHDGEPAPKKTKEYARGMFFGREVSFVRTFSDHYITDEEVNGLLQGYVIEIECKTKNSPKESVRIRLQQRQGEHGRYFGIVSAWMKKEFDENYGEKDIVWS